MLGSRPFYFLGSNAYWLMEAAAHGDTASVKDLCADARSLGMTVLRTWAFYDSPDSTNPAVIQYRPGVLSESALRALDFVVLQAKSHGLRLVMPLVNSWDDYGGMNQYVRWRAEAGLSAGGVAGTGSRRAGNETVVGQHGRSYRISPVSGFSHDDFYADTLIRRWFRNYVREIVERVNVFTGARYADEPAIFGWELANEPRSSDRSGSLIAEWVSNVSGYIKSVDGNHLVGTGEEGFDIGAAPYTVQAYGGQDWLFDGTAGVSFSANTNVPSVDFGSIHLYPESWGITNGAGGAWIRDHIHVAAVEGKPMVVGEFGVRELKAATYDSWLTTAVLGGAAGALLWQLLAGQRMDPEGFGIRCPGDEGVCPVLSAAAQEFAVKSQGNRPELPASVMLLQNYPNPFNAQTTIAFALPFDAQVRLELFTMAGEKVVTVAQDFRGAGLWKELVDALRLPSGAYVYRLVATGAGVQHAEARKLLIVK